MASNYQNKIPCALRNNEIVYPFNVERGLKCNCTCLSCGEKLVAKKRGDTYYFSHYQGTSCEYAYQTALHLMAKDIIAEIKQIKLPALYAKINGTNLTRKIQDDIVVNIERVELEKRISDIIPDIILYANNQMYFIEIYVTHKIDEEKKKKIRNYGIPTIEIDLSKNKNLSKLTLSEELIYNTQNKKWIYHKKDRLNLEDCPKIRYRECKDEKVQSRICVKGRESIRFISTGNRIVEQCPLNLRDVYLQQCNKCQYFLKENNQKGIFCGYEEFIVPIDKSEKIKDDFKFWFSSFKQERNDIIKCISQDVCPKCYYKKVKKYFNKENNEFFLECDHCKNRIKMKDEFTVIVDMIESTFEFKLSNTI